MARKPSISRTPVSGSLAEAVGAFYSTCQDLRDQMGEVRDALEERFSSTSRYEAVSEAASTLENFCDEEPDVPEPPAGCVDPEACSWVENRHPRASRRDQRDSAVSAADAAISCIEEHEAVVQQLIDRLDEEPEGRSEEAELDALEDYQLALGELREKLESDRSSAEEVEFPGMYG